MILQMNLLWISSQIHLNQINAYSELMQYENVVTVNVLIKLFI